MKKILPLLFAALLIQSCKTDLELNAPYKDITVVYALLNSKDSLQFIKINKAFLGEGDALVFAQIPDSNEYRSEDIEYARVHRVEGGVRTETWDLTPIQVDRDPGPFYSPHTLYYFSDYVESVPLGDTVTYYYLRQNAEYELDLMVKGKHITAITNIVNDFTLGTSLLQSPIINLYNTQGYLNLTLAWNQAQDGKRYQLLCHTIYTEVLDGNSTLERATLNLGSVIASADVGGQLSIPMNTEQYYSNLRNSIPEIAGVQRIFHGLEFEFIVANNEFNTALSLSEPVSGIIEDRPEYSNVINGYGVFAGRYNKKLTPLKEIGGASFDELKDGQYTANLNFDCYQYGNDGVICP
jgi:hypothetical protein